MFDALSANNQFRIKLSEDLDKCLQGELTLDQICDKHNKKYSEKLVMQGLAHIVAQRPDKSYPVLQQITQRHRSLSGGIYKSLRAQVDLWAQNRDTFRRTLSQYQCREEPKLAMIALIEIIDERVDNNHPIMKQIRQVAMTVLGFME